MNSKWTTARLKDLALINRESYSRSDGWDFVNYLDTGSITKGVIDKITLIDLRHEKLPSRARRKVAPYDIIYSTVRPNQEHYGIIRHPVANMLVSTGFVTITAKEGVDAQYLYYYLSQPQITTYLHAIAEQRVSTYPALNVSDLEELPITVPPLRIQQEIGEMLSCLDAKIDLNDRMNENLEKQAQAIFKSWFVDFEPFRDGEFVDSIIGSIPKGWKVEKLEDLVNIKYGKNHRSLPDGDIPVYGSGGLIRYISEAIYTSESVLIPRKGTLNNVMLVNHPFWSVDTMFYTEINKPNFAKFLFQLLKRKDLASMNVGSAVPSMTVALLNQIRFVLPPDEILEQFERVTNPFYLKIENNRRQNQILAALRDTLLPKLMSGEIEVPVV